MPDIKDKARPAGHGARDDAPEKVARKRYRGADQPQGSDPADRRPTEPDAVESYGVPERDKQYGGDDN